jgi:hypothetical protein
MSTKTRFIQREYSVGFDSKSEYLLIVEIVDDVPIVSYNVKIPASLALLPNSLHSKN